jgi:hypothetical protein
MNNLEPSERMEKQSLKREESRMEAAPEYANIGRMAKRGPLYLEVDRFY